jgi:hypothetical protein
VTRRINAGQAAGGGEHDSAVHERPGLEQRQLIWNFSKLKLKVIEVLDLNPTI